MNTSKKTPDIQQFDLEDLISFRNHPFKLYEGQRLADMIESIRAHGVINPIIIRPYAGKEYKYEILSGHNRVAAAKLAGFKEIPAICMSDLTEEDAMLIVTETNLYQRSFTDLTPSERAAVLAVHYEAMKKDPGYRPHLLAEIEEMSGAPVGHRMRTRDKLGEEYGLGKTTIARYLHINRLIPALKERLDKNEIGIRVGESLSFLKITEQELLEELLVEGKKINMEQAEALRRNSKEGELTKPLICEILDSEHSSQKVMPVKLSNQLLSKYFRPEQNKAEVEDIISKALEQYFANQNK